MRTHLGSGINLGDRSVLTRCLVCIDFLSLLTGFMVSSLSVQLNSKPILALMTSLWGVLTMKSGYKLFDYM